MPSSRAAFPVLFLLVGIGPVACSPSDGELEDKIVRVGRQNNSGTYHYFREAVLGEEREFKLGSIDQSGSKDVIALVAKTPLAIGYSGMAYATPEVKMLNISRKRGETVVAPTSEAAADGRYPISRPLFIYAREEPQGAVKAYLDWILSSAGQKVVEEIGYVPVKKEGGAPGEAPDSSVTIRVKGSDTMVNLAQAWAEEYNKTHPNVAIQVAGGGSSVGIAGLINGTVDLANASRKMEPTEIAEAKKNNGVEPKEFTVGLDALAVYVHKDNPIDDLSLEELAEIYGQGGEVEQWSQLANYKK